MSVTALQNRVVTAVTEAAPSGRSIQASAQVSTQTVSTPSVEAARLIQYVSQQSNVAPEAKMQIIDMAVLADNFINNPSGRHKVYSQLAGVGIYLGSVSTKEYPKFSDLTGLRYYAGMNMKLAATGQPVPALEVSAKPPQMPTADDYAQAAAQRIEQTLMKVVQQNAPVTFENVKQVVETVQKMSEGPKQMAQAVGAQVEVKEVAASHSKPSKVVEA